MLYQLPEADKTTEAVIKPTREKLAAKVEWLPIKKAPKNEDMFLGYVPHSCGGYVCCFYWNKKLKQWQNNIDGGCDRPTHWMPLPPFPQEAVDDRI